jgi:predicted ATP-grasp superfamily ATP-dependent carboligase
MERHQGSLPILIPTTDRDVIWTDENAAALREVFRFPVRDAALIRTLCDKNRMQELARTVGVSVAPSMVPVSNQEVAHFAETAIFPVMVKAIDAERLRARLGGTKFLIHSAAELREICAKALDAQEPNFLIQEFIPGEDWMFEGCFDQDSRCLFGVTAKKIRRFPPRTGVTSLGVCQANEAVYRTTTEFMKAIGYRGILDIGYRLDSRNGQYRVLDVNPRIGCTFRLFAADDGMDVVRALYLDMTGEVVPPARVTEGRKWIAEDFDFVSALHSCTAGDLKVKDWVRSLRGVHESACFSLDDPLPVLMVGVADCFELYRWVRAWAGARKRAERASGSAPATSSWQLRKGV